MFSTVPSSTKLLKHAPSCKKRKRVSNCSKHRSCYELMKVFSCLLLFFWIKYILGNDFSVRNDLAKRGARSSLSKDLCCLLWNSPHPFLSWNVHSLLMQHIQVDDTRNQMEVFLPPQDFRLDSYKGHPSAHSAFSPYEHVLCQHVCMQYIGLAPSPAHPSPCAAV